MATNTKNNNSSTLVDVDANPISSTDTAQANNLANNNVDANSKKSVVDTNTATPVDAASVVPVNAVKTADNAPIVNTNANAPANNTSTTASTTTTTASTAADSTITQADIDKNNEINAKTREENNAYRAGNGVDHTVPVNAASTVGSDTVIPEMVTNITGRNGAILPQYTRANMNKDDNNNIVTSESPEKNTNKVPKPAILPGKENKTAQTGLTGELEQHAIDAELAGDYEKHAVCQNILQAFTDFRYVLQEAEKYVRDDLSKLIADIKSRL